MSDFIPTYPDHNVRDSQYAAPIIDSAETVARQGGFGNRRSGTVIWLSSFEAGLSEMWGYDPSATDGDIVLHTAGDDELLAVLHGRRLVEIIPATSAGSDGNFAMSLGKSMPAVYSGACGFEVNICAPEGSSPDIETVVVSMIRWASDWYGAQIKLDLVNKKIYYMSGYAAGPVYTYLADFPDGAIVSAAEKLWCNIKLVADLSVAVPVYKRLLFNNWEYSGIDGIALPSAVPSVSELHKIQLMLTAIDNGGTAGPIYTDCWTFTIDEASG